MKTSVGYETEPFLNDFFFPGMMLHGLSGIREKNNRVLFLILKMSAGKAIIRAGSDWKNSRWDSFVRCFIYL